MVECFVFREILTHVLSASHFVILHTFRGHSEPRAQDAIVVMLFCHVVLCLFFFQLLLLVSFIFFIFCVFVMVTISVREGEFHCCHIFKWRKDEENVIKSKNSSQIAPWWSACNVLSQVEMAVASCCDCTILFLISFDIIHLRFSGNAFD